MIVVDIETSGFNVNKNDLIELGAVLLNDDLTVKSEFHCYLKPVKPQYWKYEAENIHGITLNEAMCFKDGRESLIDFLNYLAPELENFPLKFICHAKNKWDYNFLKGTFLKFGLIESFFKAFNAEHYESTIDLSRETLELPNYKLNTVCEALSIDLTHHKALSDAKACSEIYRLLKPKFEHNKMGLFQDMNI